MAKDLQKPPYALVAGAIEQLIIGWTHEVVPQESVDARGNVAAVR
jgi:hypothetical protein